MDTHSADAVPAMLSDLIAAGLVTHEMIGDPARLSQEAPVLRQLCGLVAGTVYRLGRLHYAFRAGPADLGGRLAALAPGDWTAALEAAFQEALGADAVWVNAAGLAVDEAAAGEGVLDQPLLLLRAQEGAVADGLAAAPPGMRAVIDARYATETARLTAAAVTGAVAGSALDARLAALEAGQAEILARLAAIGSEAAEFDARLGLTLAEFLAQLEPQTATGAGR